MDMRNRNWFTLSNAKRRSV